MPDKELREVLARYQPQDILSADTDLFLHAFEDYDGVFAKHASDMSAKELSEAVSREHLAILAKYLS